MQTPSVPTSYLLTFDGNVQRVDTALGLTFPDGENSIAELLLQADPANGAVCYFGGADVSANGTQIPAAAAGVSAAPVRIAPLTNNQLRLSQLYVKGTNAQKLRLFVIPYNR